MLRRNIDVTVEFVDGARGTVDRYATRTSIKSDHIDVPCDMKRVTSRLMLSKNLYVHSTVFSYTFLTEVFELCCLVEHSIIFQHFYCNIFLANLR
uniref:Uncharacterized protein n=1 Tax=Amphimedon queenslandica TaxID=400682 RepID=A0A1X7V827_AMPQE